MDLSIEGTLFHKGGFEHGCLGIKDGKIHAIKKTLKAEQHIDVGHQLILPAGIDLHVHFRDPGFPHKEDFSTGSLAAAFGGISCVMDMPNTQPPTTSISSIQEKVHSAQTRSYVDFGIYAAITNQNIGRIATLSPLCSGFKIYLGSSTQATVLSPQHLRAAFFESQRSQKLILIHAEDEPCLKRHHAVERNLVDHLRCRPSACEETALHDVLRNAQGLSPPIHICHLSSCEGVEVLRHRPSHISVGVTPHHLLFDVNTLTVEHTWYKVNPPIRSSFDREALWSAAQHHIIDVLESDHAPHTREEKQVEFDHAPSGVPGVETMYPLFLALVKKERLPLGTLLSLLCERPAQLLHLPKGTLEVGNDADIIVVDMNHTENITAERLHSKCGWTPFEGYPAIFPSLVFIRGEKLIQDHQMLMKPGYGTCVGV
ncbi:MAG: dihydroorotase [Candidatus Thermoplasmatota archaeon]|nr:dihydroorotase [Candidatus Thermoplasmatota archaeon]